MQGKAVQSIVDRRRALVSIVLAFTDSRENAMNATPLVLTPGASRKYCETSAIPTRLEDMDEFMRESVLQIVPVMATGRMPIDIQPLVFDDQERVITGAVSLAASVVTGMPFASYAIESVMPQARNYPHYPSTPLTALDIPEETDASRARARYHHLLAGGSLELETIDADRAKELLNALIVSPTPELCEQLRSIRWMPTGECIIVDQSGLVAEGRKRLAAIIRTQVPMKAWVLHAAQRTLLNFDTPKTLADATDGLPPSGASRAAAEGLGEAPDTSDPAQAKVRPDDIEAGIYEVLAILGSAYDLETLPVRDDDLKWRPTVLLSRLMSKQSDVAVAARAAFSMIDAADADHFFKAITTGKGSSAAAALRQAFNRQFISLTGIEARDRLLRQCCKAWRHHRAGKEVSVLRLQKNDGFDFGYDAPTGVNPAQLLALLDHLEVANIPQDIARAALEAVLAAIDLDDSYDAMPRLYPFALFANDAYEVALDRNCDPVAFIASIAVAAMDHKVAESMSFILEAIAKGTLLKDGDPLLTLHNWICANTDMLKENPAKLATGVLSAIDASIAGRRDFTLGKGTVAGNLAGILKSHFEVGGRVGQRDLHLISASSLPPNLETTG